MLQEAHDRVAAHYRYTVDPRGQMPLPFSDEEHERWLEREWTAFFTNEAARLAEDDEFVVAVLTAVVHENTPEGYAAEERLVALLGERYPVLGAQCLPNRLVRSG